MYVHKSEHLGSEGLVVKVSASQPRDHGFEPYSVHIRVRSYDTSTCWFQEADSKVQELVLQSSLNK
jgi:hypothetical protein